MLVREIGEFQLIDTLARAIATGGGDSVERLSRRDFRLRLSIGDDAAAWEDPSGVRVLTTDTLVEGVHFDLGYVTWAELGWKSLAVNLSDVAAMGCAPLYSAVTLGLRGDLPVEGLVEMYGGMLEACRRYGGAIVGGDIVKSPVFFVTVALHGAALAHEDRDARPAGRLLLRRCASPADKIAVTGHLGCSAGGLSMLAEGLEFDEETAAHLRRAHNRPEPRVGQGMTLVRQGVIAAIDISDGLVDDLGKLCKASGVAGVVHSDKVPADDFLKRAYPEDWLARALGGGEDYELLFTAPGRVLERVAPMLDVQVSVIGDIVDGPPGVTVLDRDGNVMPVERGGWDHLRQP